MAPALAERNKELQVGEYYQANKPRKARLPRPDRVKRPARYAQQLADELFFLELAFEKKRNPNGLEPEVVVRELRRLRHQFGASR